MTGRRTARTLLLLVALIAVASLPVYAQTGFGATFSQSCIVAKPGQTVTDQVTVTEGGAGKSALLSVVGSIPKGSTATVTPSNVTLSSTTTGTANFTVAIANNTDTEGSFQIGIVAKSGSAYKIVLIALHVEKPGQAAGACSKIGLSLPESTVVVTLTSVGLGLFTQLVTRRFVDLDAERRMKAELNAFNKEKRDAQIAKDKDKLEKLKKKELAMMQARSKVQLARTKVTFITIVPLFLIYYLMASFLGGYGSIVAVSPLPIPYLVGGSGEMVLFWWYIIGSFTLSSLLARLMHTNT